MEHGIDRFIDKSSFIMVFENDLWYKNKQLSVVI